ncbi:MAG: 4a-hydroxytetrahydrobiopterin dehydratase [Rickettsiales bacterium]|nr:4a-hydroxytetrahydrobiopterin dehydratase [Rickettsiales bacterium]
MNIPQGWELAASGKSISRRWIFSNFVESLAFINKLGEMAEEANHHPDIAFGWGYADVTFTTHDSDSLSDNDITMAEKTNALLVA